MTTTIFATVTANPEFTSEVEAALKAIVPLTRAETGCIRYELFRADNDLSTFHLLETYQDDAVLSSHHQSPHFAALVVRLENKLAADIEIKRFVVIGA